MDYFDPLVPYLDLEGLKMASVTLAPAGLKKYDCVIIAVDHSKVDYASIARNAKLIFDVKNVYRAKRLKNVNVL